MIIHRKFEAQKKQEPIQEVPEEQQLQQSLDKSKKELISCFDANRVVDIDGITIPNMKSGVGLSFGLLYHKENTKNFSEFCKSLASVLGVSKFSKEAIEILKVEYSR